MFEQGQNLLNDHYEGDRIHLDKQLDLINLTSLEVGYFVPFIYIEYIADLIFLMQSSLWPLIINPYYKHGLPQWLSRKESACNGGDMCSVPGVGKSPGGGPGNIF